MNRTEFETQASELMRKTSAMFDRIFSEELPTIRSATKAQSGMGADEVRVNAGTMKEASICEKKH